MSDKHAVDIPPETQALREHLRQILESRAFKGSRRSQQFLQHIVEKSLDGHGDALKERNLGVELFGRQPSYDTGDDAIVRVTASDVRKRLQQFYAEWDGEIRIEIPSGSYTPEFRRVAVTVGAAPAVAAREIPAWKVDRRIVLWGAVALLVLAGIGMLARQRATRPLARNVMPWSHMLQSGRETVVVVSDPDISAMQKLTGWELSLSDYANGKYTPDPASLDTSMQRALRTFRGANVPVVDVGIALSVSGLLTGSSGRMKTAPARSLKLGDFKVDNDFVILGSPRSNPWGGLFQDQLDFEFAYDQETKQEFVHNKRVQPGEPERYMPTARGWGTGRAYAILAVVGNPSQAGAVLLLGGTTAEATEAAGRLATNVEMLAGSLGKCGISADGPLRHFEMLLEVKTMAGSPNTFEMKACHVLADRKNP